MMSLVPCFFKAYTPLQYSEPGEITYDPDQPFLKRVTADRSTIKEGVEPTAGKFIGGFIEDVLMSNLISGNVSVRAKRDILKEGINWSKGIQGAIQGSAFKALIKTLKEEDMSMEEWLGYSAIGFLIRMFEPTVMVGETEVSVKSAKDILKKYGFKDKDFEDPVSLKTKWRQTAKKIHPDRGGSEEAFKALSTSYTEYKNL